MSLRVLLDRTAFAGNLPYTAFWTRAFDGPLRYEWQSNWRAFLVNEETGVRTSLWGNTFTPWGWGQLTGWASFDAGGGLLNRVSLPRMPLQDLLGTIAAVRDGDIAALLDLMAAGPAGMSSFVGLHPATLPVVPGGLGVMPVHVTVQGNGLFQGETGDPAHDDTILTGPVRGSTITALGGHDRIETGGDALSVHEVWAGSGNDTVLAGAGRHDIAGGPGDDRIDARAAAGSRLHGGDGNDTVTGGAGDDRLLLGAGNDRGEGGDGNDTLIPGPGADLLVGGAGADTFVIRHLSGWNRIADFDPAQGDVLALGRGLWEPRLGPMTAAEVVAAFGRIAGGGDMVLDFGSADAIVRLVGLDDPAALAGAITIL